MDLIQNLQNAYGWVYYIPTIAAPVAAGPQWRLRCSRPLKRMAGRRFAIGINDGRSEEALAEGPE